MMTLNVILVALAALNAVNAEVISLTGRFQNGLQGNVEIDVTDASVTEIVHKPQKDGQFLETHNRYYFDQHRVVIKDDEDETCFIRRFNKTKDEIVQRINQAKQHGSSIGAFKEMWISTGSLSEFDSESVMELFGADVAEYCHKYRVVYINSKHSGLVGTEKHVPGSRRRRWILLVAKVALAILFG